MEAVFDIPTIFVIFGATGDLTQKKLLPSLYHLDKQAMLPEKFKVIAFARKEKTDRFYLDEIKQQLSQQFAFTFSETSWQKFAQKVTYHQGDFTKEEAFVGLAKKLNEIDMQLGVCTHKIFYLAVTPDLYETVLQGIKKTQLQQICKNEKDTRIIMEKPFGSSLASFQKLNQLALSLFTEKQIYRIDHLVGKETVQNILYFRAANPAIASTINRGCIKGVRINYYEAIGVGGRGGYYDVYGHLRDMVQSHLLQLLALTLMDLPKELRPAEISKAKTEIIKSLAIENLDQDIIRGQYVKGVVEGKTVVGYRDEPGIPKDSSTETLVKIKAKLHGGKWEGLPVVLATGKRLNKKVTEVIIDYEEQQLVSGIKGGNRLVIRIQPEEGITLRLMVKKPETDDLDTVDMSFKYKESFPALLPEAYEKIILDIIRKSDAFDITSEELEASWSFVDPIIKKFASSSGDLLFYPAGSNELLEN